MVNIHPSGSTEIDGPVVNGPGGTGNPKRLGSIPRSACSKVRYATEAAAWLALDELDGKRHLGKKESSAYRCRRCKGWHLTSQAPRWARRNSG